MLELIARTGGAIMARTKKDAGQELPENGEAKAKAPKRTPKKKPSAAADLPSLRNQAEEAKAALEVAARDATLGGRLARERGAGRRLPGPGNGGRRRPAPGITLLNV